MKRDLRRDPVGGFAHLITVGGRASSPVTRALAEGASDLLEENERLRDALLEAYLWMGRTGAGFLDRKNLWKARRQVAQVLGLDDGTVGGR